MRDGLLLSVGTLTALRVPTPRRVDSTTAGAAMLLAPVAVLPLAVLVGLVTWALPQHLDVSAGVTGVACVIVLALGTRALHLDGLSDVADALTSGYDRERSLAVMKDSSAGPAGVAALVLTLGLQAFGFAAVSTAERGWAVAALAVIASRAALAIACARPIPPARDSGLAVHYARTVPVVAAALTWLAISAAAVGVYAWADPAWWRGPLAIALTLVAVGAVLRRCVTRFGGVTGDVFGATIEISLAVMLAAS